MLLFLFISQLFFSVFFAVLYLTDKRKKKSVGERSLFLLKLTVVTKGKLFIKIARVLGLYFKN